MIDALVPPHSLDAEKALLGAVLVDNRLLDAVVDVITPEDFYRDAHQRIYRQILALDQADCRVDFLTLQEALAQAGDLERVDGPAYLARLTDGVPFSSNAVHYAQIVREKAIRRALLQAAQQTMHAAVLADADAAVVLEQAQQRLWAIALQEPQSDLVGVDVLIRETWALLEECAARKGELRGVPTGLVDLDALLGGLQATDLIILAARPAMGKTGLAVNIATTAIKAGVRTAVFSLEMSRQQVLCRLLASEAQVNLKRLLEGRTSDVEYQRIGATLNALGNWPLHVDETALVTVSEIRAKCRRLQSQHGLGLIVVDYLQLMTDPKRHDSRVLELATISRGLKQIAKELKVPVLALSQLSREVERRKPPRPQLADLRDSGALEQDADVVLLLWREEEYEATAQNQGIAEVIIGKQRNGPTGAVTVKFFKEQTRFANLSRQ